MADDAPDILWHYTSVDGLLGIIRSKCLWATHSAHLNDLTEGIRPIQYVRNVVAELKTEAASDSDLLTLERLHQHMLPLLSFHRYVACFCAVADRLDQWRSYTPRGRGYALGFRRTVLENVSGFDLRRIEYQPPEDAESEIESCIRDALQETQGTEVSERTAQLMARVFPWLARHALVLKHSAFEEEVEWRLCTRFKQPDEPEPVRCFRAGPTGIVPYLEIPLPSDAIGQIIIGPGLEKNVFQTDGLTNLLSEHGFSVPYIRSSSVPLRFG